MQETTNQHEINYLVEGEGPPVILIHGIAASLYDWDMVRPVLLTAWFKTFAVDLPGHGDSVKPDDPHLYKANVVYEALESWINSLNLNQPPVLIGHSLGGYLSLRYGLRNPQVPRALVLLDPFYTPAQLHPVMRMLNRRPKVGENALRYLPSWLIHSATSAAAKFDPTQGAGSEPERREKTANDYLRASPHIFRITHSSGDLSSQLPEIQAKTLVIWGERDFTLRPSSFPQLVEQMPHATGYSVAGCGHQPHICRPEEVSRVLIEFLHSLGI